MSMPSYLRHKVKKEEERKRVIFPLMQIHLSVIITSIKKGRVMKHLLFSFILLCGAGFLASCSNDNSTNDTYSEAEQIKIQRMMNLLESHGFELDSMVSIKERNQELLKLDYDSVKDFLETLEK